MSLQAQIIGLVSDAIGDPRVNFLSVRRFRRLEHEADSRITMAANRSRISETELRMKVAESVSRISAPVSTSSLDEAIVLASYQAAGKFWAERNGRTFINDKVFHKLSLGRYPGKGKTLLELCGVDLPDNKGISKFEEDFNSLFLSLAKLLKKNSLSKDDILKALSLDNFKFNDKDLDSLMKHLQNDKPFVDKLHIFLEYTQAPPYRSISTPTFDIKSEIIPDIHLFRMQLLDYFINSVITPNSSALKAMKELQHGLSESFYYDGLTVEYGNSSDNLFDAIQSCINGVQGKCREAAIVYELDPEVEIIGLYPHANNHKLRQVVKAITVKTKDEDTGESKLVIDGVLANDDLDKILSLDWRPIISQGIINYAQNQDIKKIVLNTQNSTSHESATQFKQWVATTILGLQEGVDFECPFDSKTGHHGFILNPKYFTKSLKVSNREFSYTHNLTKKPMPDSVIQNLDIGQDYRGESYFDTWHNFNNFARDVRSSGDSKIERTFPCMLNFVESRNAVWNQGCGPVIGLEIDVEKASARLDLHLQAT